ncbi:MAG: photosynthetic reaction center subunit H [Pseudomonadota bacterium]
MIEEAVIVGRIDLALVSLYLFWAFFAGLVIYLQRENMREGYPLENDDGTPAANQGPYGLPSPKTFKLPHGRGERTYPNNDKQDDRPIALAQTSVSNGAPFVPTGDPLADGVGPASYAMRQDVPELDGHGHVKIRPLAMLGDYHISAGMDARGMPVVSHDRKQVGTVTDLWVDVPEQLVRYLEFELVDGGGKRLIPITLLKVTGDRYVKVHSLYAHNFPGVPTTAKPDEVTLLEEDKICGYYCGGKLYASPDRLEPQIQ